MYSHRKRTNQMFAILQSHTIRINIRSPPRQEINPRHVCNVNLLLLRTTQLVRPGELQRKVRMKVKNTTWFISVQKPQEDVPFV